LLYKLYFFLFVYSSSCDMKYDILIWGLWLEHRVWDCNMHCYHIRLRRKEILLIIFRHCVEPPARNRYMNNRFWTTFEIASPLW